VLHPVFTFFSIQNPLPSCRLVDRGTAGRSRIVLRSSRSSKYRYSCKNSDAGGGIGGGGVVVILIKKDLFLGLRIRRRRYTLGKSCGKGQNPVFSGGGLLDIK